jgi:hypothetical protein
MAEKAVSNTAQCGFESHPGHFSAGSASSEGVGAAREDAVMYPLTVRLEAKELLQSGWSLNAVSKELGVSRSALRDWRDSGFMSGGNAPSCFVCVEDVEVDASAYVLLLGYYLGDGCVSRAPRTYVLRVSCDRNYPGIVAEVGRVIVSVNPNAAVCHVQAPGVIVVQSCWNHWPCVFPQHGPGRKHERALILAEWQRDLVANHPVDLLRGLFRSDGCRTNNWATGTVAGEPKRYDYPRWQFVNHSSDIRAWCTEALDLLDIPWRQSNWKTISVSTRAGVARLDELVGPKC